MVAGFHSQSRAGAVIAALAGACQPAAHVSLAPQYGECAPPAIVNSIQVIAYAGDGEHTETLSRGETLAIDNFPADTVQIGVNLLGANGEVSFAGKSMPLVFNALDDGAEIPVFLAPLHGFCAVGPMTDSRVQPLVAPAGAGVLVVGGFAAQPDGSPGAPLSTVELYDPSTSAFTSIKTPGALVDASGFVGATLTPLPDGRLALIGGPQHAFTVFDPTTRTFTDPPALIDPYLFHAAVATPAGDVIVAGGCSSLDKTGACVPRHQIVAYTPDKLGAPDAELPVMAATRQAAQIFDLGEQADGRVHYLVTGGGAPGADRFAVGDMTTAVIDGGSEQAAQLDAGAVVTAFVTDPRTGAVTGTAAVYAADASPARTVATAQPMLGARMIGLEDGRAAAFGTLAANGLTTVEVYDPTRNTWDPDVFAAGGPPQLVAPSLVRLGDGSVLVFGGSKDHTAWRYRPSLVGPASGTLTAIPGQGNDPNILTPADPSTVRVTPGASRDDWHLRIAAGTADTPTHPALARALIGGPRMASGSVSAVVTVGHGGAALVAEQVAPGRAVVAMFTAGRPARVVQLAGGAAHTVCEGDAVPALAGATISLAIRGRTATLSVDGASVGQCSLPATASGAWGVAAIGPDAKPDGDDADVTVGLVTVARK